MTNQQHSNKQKENFLYTCKNKTKQVHKTNKKTDRMFVHTPKLKCHIVPNVVRNTLQWDEESG
jgi:hypothetical protein